MVTQGGLGRRCRDNIVTIKMFYRLRRQGTMIPTCLTQGLTPATMNPVLARCIHGTSSIIRVHISIYVLGFRKVDVLLWSLVPGIGKPYPMIADTKNGGEGRVCAAFNDPISISCSIFPGFIVLQISLILGNTERTRDWICSLRRSAETKPGTMVWLIPQWD
jgi:hypothetical protein